MTRLFILSFLLLSAAPFGFSFLSTKSMRHGKCFGQYQYRSAAMKMVANPFGDLLNSRNLLSIPSNPTQTIAEKFIEEWNANRITEATNLVDDDIEFEDAIFPGPFVGKEELERILRLSSENFPTIVTKLPSRMLPTTTFRKKLGLDFILKGLTDPSTKRVQHLLLLIPIRGSSRKYFLVKENNKSGEANLTLLRRATAFADLFKSKDGTENTQATTTIDMDADITSTTTSNSPMSWFFPKASVPSSSTTLPEQYFAAWNERDMVKACSLFSEFCEYDDTAFLAPFQGKEALEKHLKICADSFPSTFEFCVDDQIIGDNKNF